MKYSAYIVIALLALLAACTKAELCYDEDHPHRAGVQFAFDWDANVTSDVKATHQLPDSMLVLVKRIIGTELTGCRVSATDGKGFYLFDSPYVIPTSDGTGDDGASEDGTGDDGETGTDDGDDGGSDSGMPADDGSGDSGSDDGSDGGTSASARAASVEPAVPGYTEATDLFKVRPGMFKCITVNRDTTEFEYNEIFDYAEGGWAETTLHELCMEYKRYKYGSEKLRNQVPGWQDYNIYGDANNFLQPDMAPIYYDSISPCTIDRNTVQTFKFSPILLTQNIDIRFHVRKKVDVEPFLIDSICAEISGIPYRLNLSRDVFDIRNTAKMRFMCKLEDGNGHVIDDTPTNEYLLCHGNIDVLSLVNAPNPRAIRGPGIMQLMVKIKDHKTIRVKVNLFNAIERANLYHALDNGEWAHRRKDHGVLEIDTNLVIDEKAVLPSDQGNGMEEWIQAGEDDIVVDT